MPRPLPGLRALAFRLVLVALGALALVRCAGADQADVAEAPDASQQATDAPAVGGRDSAPVAAQPEFDLGAVMRQVHFAYRAEDDGFRGGHSTFDVAVTGAGRFSFTPIHWGEAPGGAAVDPPAVAGATPTDDEPDPAGADGEPPADRAIGAPAHFETVRVRRGSAVLEGAPVTAVDPTDGTLTVTRGPVVERLRNDEEGVHQSWSFAERPAGAGALVVEVAVTGMTYLAATEQGLHFADGETGLGASYGLGTFIDARGERTPVVPRWEDGVIRLEVPAEVVQRAAFPAVLDPTIGAEFAIGTPVTGPSDTSSGADVAWGGAANAFLVVWTDNRTTGTTTRVIMGARVTAAGVVQDPAGITISTTTGTAGEPDVAYDGTNFFVVWAQGTNIQGQRISAAGARVGSELLVTNNGSTPDVAWNGSTYLVVWESNVGVVGQRVTSAGALNGAAVTIAAGSANDKPAVGATGTQFLVAWYSGVSFYAQRLDTNAALTGAAITLYSGTGTCTGCDGPEVAGNGTNWLVGILHWNDDLLRIAPVSNAGALGTVVQLASTGAVSTFDLTFGAGNYFAARQDNGGIVSTRLSAAGASLDGTGVVVSARGGGPAVAGGGSTYLVALASYPTTAAITVSRVASTGALTDATPILVTQTTNKQSTPAVAWGGGNYFVVWADARSGVTNLRDIYGARVSSSGSLLDGAGVAIATGTADEYAPDVAWSGSQYAVVWYQSGTGGGAYVRRYSASAGALAAPVLVLTSSNGTEPSVAGNGTDFLVIGGIGPAARTVSAAGALGTQITAGVGSPSAVAWDGANYVLVGGGSAIVMRRVSSAGTLVDAANVAVSNGSGAESNTAVAGSGNGSLVVWQDTRNGNTDVYGARISQAGAVLDATGIAISTAAGTQSAPAVTWAGDGSNYVVAWQDARTNATGDVYAAWVSTAGTVLDPAGVAISTDAALGETTPDLAADGAGGQLVTYVRFDPTNGVQSPRVKGRILGGGQVLGTGCTTGTQCASRSCTDATCCTTATCPGVCSTCAPGGTCASVVGADDADTCTGVNTCDATGTCKKKNGQTCAAASECASANCVDGYCCNTACAGGCDVCSATPGTCTAVASGSAGANPSCAPYLCTGTSACPTSCTGDAQCASSNYCNAAGACVPKKANAAACNATSDCRVAGCAMCTSGNCVDGYCCNTACGGSCDSCATTPGTCTNQPGNAPGSPSCAPFYCSGTGPGCDTTCSVHADCVSGAYCSTGGTCQFLKPLGGACTDAFECTSNFCVDGVCCNSACNTSCQSCTALLKGTGQDGYCGNTDAGKDPHSDCTDQGGCGFDGTCNGGGTCRYYVSGTPCGASSCTGNSVTGPVCNGAGGCVTSTGQDCAPYVCSGGACASPCASDAGCTSGNWCDAGTCKPRAGNGAACTAGSQCSSGNCVDGVCCNLSCTGACLACTAVKKGSGVDGECGSIAAGSDPDTECTDVRDSDPNGCGTTGTCNGIGSCAQYAFGTACGSTCSSGQRGNLVCNGTGSCIPQSSAPCDPYVCADATSCGTTCSTNAGCSASGWCRLADGTCQLDQQNGAPCGTGAECVSGQCVDGVCCNSSCTGGCQACSASKKGSGLDGECGTIADGLDPDSECADQAATSCGTTGTCNGLGACGLFPQGTGCGVSCVGGAINYGSCNGAGQCLPASSVSCAPYGCADATQCATTCADDTDCAAASYCNVATGTCDADLPVGSTCTGAGECASGHCVDGVCCNTSCAGTCSACTALLKGGGLDGECGPVPDGTDADGDCSDDGAVSCDRDGTCDGVGACRLYTRGVSCGSTQCVGNSVRGLICDGFGACITDSAGTDCAPYLCRGSGCTTPCGSDADCSAGNFCDAGTCRGPRALGESCVAAAQCGSGQCVDGFCCDSACGGACVACSAALKGGGNDGECGPVAEGTDPSSDCPEDGAGTCDRDGECNGQGACRLYTRGTSCGGGQCAASVLRPLVCDGLGGCGLDATGVDCAPFACLGGACVLACSTDAECVGGAFCSGGSCVGRLTQGSACTQGSQCASGQCADGVCCDASCAGACVACTAALKGSGIDGECGPVPAATVDALCPDDGAQSCQRNGACDGNGACGRYPSGTPCGATSCVGNSIRGRICDGVGSCTTESVGQDCGAFRCQGDACANPCAADSDCAAGYWCNAGACVGQAANGEACTVASRCQSGSCVDGFCCDSTCTGQCEACNVAGQEGACVPVTGAPRGSRSSCSGTGVCAGSCDGTNGSVCTYPGETVECDASCSDGRQTLSVCNALGACQTGTAEPCPGGFACDGATRCLTACADDMDCATGFVCDANGDCSPPPPATCSSDLSRSESALGTTECSPYRCDASTGACRDSCADTADCAPGHACDAASQVCVRLAPTAAADDGGCGCAVPGQRPGSRGALLLAALGALALRRRGSGRGSAPTRA